MGLAEAGSVRDRPGGAHERVFADHGGVCRRLAGHDQRRRWWGVRAGGARGAVPPVGAAAV